MSDGNFNAVPEGYGVSSADLSNSRIMGSLANLQRYVQTTTIDSINANSAANRNIADMLTRMLGLNPAREMMQSGNMFEQLGGYAANQASAAFLRQIPGMGAPADMFGGVQQAVLSGGMRMFDSGSGMSSPMPIYGAAASSVSAEITRRLQNHFFPAYNNGMPVMSRTMGLNTQEIGDIVADMGSRGAFAGMNVTNQSVLSADDIARRKRTADLSGDEAMKAQAAALRVGDFNVELRDDAITKIQELSQKAVKSMSWLKGVLGAMPMAQLRAEAEQLTGTNVASPGGMDLMNSRMAGMLATGRTFGMSDIGAMNFHASTAATMDQILSNQTGAAPGSYSKFAGAASGLVARLGLSQTSIHGKAAQAAAGRGEFYMMPEQADVTAMAANDIARIAAQEPELIAASYAATAVPMAAKNRQALEASIEAFRTAGTPEQRMRAQDDLNRSVRENAGMNVDGMMRNVGLGPMLNAISTSPDQLNRLVLGMQGSSQERNANLYRQLYDEAYTDNSWVSKVGGADAATKLTLELGQIPTDRQTKFQEALRNNPSVSSLEAVLQGASLPDGMTAGGLARSAMAANQQLLAQDFPGGLSSAMIDMARARTANPYLLGDLPYEDMQNAVRDQQRTQRTTEQLGEYEPPANPILDFMTGLLGGEAALANKDVIDYAQLNEDGKGIMGLDIDPLTDGLKTDKMSEAELKKLDEWTRTQKGGKFGIMNRLGLEKDDYEGLRKKLAGKDGASALMEAMRGNENAVISPGTDDKGNVDKILIADPEMREKMKDEIKQAPPAQKTGGGFLDWLGGFFGASAGGSEAVPLSSKSQSSVDLQRDTERRGQGEKAIPVYIVGTQGLSSSAFGLSSLNG